MTCPLKVHFLPVSIIHFDVVIPAAVTTFYWGLDLEKKNIPINKQLVENMFFFSMSYVEMQPSLKCVAKRVVLIIVFAVSIKQY